MHRQHCQIPPARRPVSLAQIARDFASFWGLTGARGGVLIGMALGLGIAAVMQHVTALICRA